LRETREGEALNPPVIGFISRTVHREHSERHPLPAMCTPILLPIPPAYSLVLSAVSLALIFSTVQSVYIGPTRPRKLRRESLPRHRLQACGRTDLSSPSPRASHYAGSVGVLSTSTTIRWVQSGMVVPDKPSMGHAVVFWLNQYTLHRLSVKAAWNVSAMGQ
jgi:hypothetical protein